mmetsp:Transcript_6617/g.9784  ORF Transcript_6617/g.9784 Transcript_6617/m.9784 type:complete len:277 (+) Transcript_6617:15-845(+)
MDRSDSNVYLHIKGAQQNTGICILDILECSENITRLVYLKHHRTKSFCSLSSEPLQGKHVYNLNLVHSTSCPARRFTQELGNHQTIPKPVKIACCLLIESQDNKFLLTRRTEVLSVFPKAWVFPGGKLDPFETLEAAAVREAHEEVGLDLQSTPSGYFYKGQPVELTPLCMYESVFPQHLEIGLPRHQHLIVFFYLKLHVKTKQVNLRLDRNEVDYAVWVTKDQLKQTEGVLQGVDCDRRKVDIHSSQLAGLAPNYLGEGLGEAHFSALKVLFGEF